MRTSASGAVGTHRVRARHPGEALRVPTRIDEVQWLRAFAALIVFGEHLKNEVANRLLLQDAAASPLAVFPYAAGVDMFFVISGFVMAHASRSLFGQPDAWRRFLWRRVARVVPLYWLVTTAVVALLVLRGGRFVADPASAWQIASSYLFVPSVNQAGTVTPVLPIGWTLNYEMFFYGVFALFVGWKRPYALAAVAAFMGTMALAGLVLDLPGVPLSFWADPIVLEFVAGIGLFVLVERGFRLGGATRLLLVAVALVVLALFPQPDIGPRVVVWGLPAVALALAAVAGSPRRATPLSRAASFVGDVSYAVYLTHLPILAAFGVVFASVGLTSRPAAYLLFPAVTLATTLVVSALAHLFFERPVLAAARRIGTNGTSVGEPPGP